MSPNLVPVHEVPEERMKRMVAMSNRICEMVSATTGMCRHDALCAILNTYFIAANHWDLVDMAIETAAQNALAIRQQRDSAPSGPLH